jgi:hypothetical protein
MLAVLWLPLFARAAESPAEKEQALNKRAFEFFQKNAQQETSRYAYNPYENIISGIAAFVFGNVGYLTTDSSSLKVTYSAVQTIGIINIGQGIYKAQAPSVDRSFRDMLAEDKTKSFTKERLAGNLLKLFAQEDRAKRLSVFYSSGFLTVQYAMNATIYKSSGQLKKVYLFLGGVNVIVALYSAFSKSKYEEAYYGGELDISPFASMNGSDEAAYGLMVGGRF